LTTIPQIKKLQLTLNSVLLIFKTASYYGQAMKIKGQGWQDVCY